MSKSEYRIVSSVEQQRDIMDIMRCVRDATEGTIVHVPEVLSNDGHVKKYVYKDNNWVFVKRMTQSEAEEDDAGSVTDETELVNNAKEVLKAAAPAPLKKRANEDKDPKEFTLSDLKQAISDFDLDAAVDMIDRLMDALGDDIMKKSDKNKKQRRVKARKSEEDGGPVKEKSEYHQFLSKVLSEMKGDKSIPRNQRMMIASQRWKEHVAARNST